MEACGPASLEPTGRPKQGERRELASPKIVLGSLHDGSLIMACANSAHTTHTYTDNK